MRGLVVMSIDESKYLEYLKDFTIDETVSDERRLTYDILLNKLWDAIFHGHIGNDYDREYDGLDLRVGYTNVLMKHGIDVGCDIYSEFGDCRVLEMLIALSMHMYDLMQDMGLYNSVSRWFWEIMKNVGFDELDDDSYQALDGDRVVEKVLDDISNLHQRKSGRPGGWFYVKDWTDIELWYQMHEYLSRYFRA